MSQSSSKKSNAPLWIVGVLVLVAAGIVGWVISRQIQQPGGNGLSVSQSDQENLSLAAAYLENAEFSKALVLFQKAEATFPESKVLKKNLAVAIIASIKSKVNELNQPDSDKVAIRESLPGMLDQAQAAINSLVAARLTILSVINSMSNSNSNELD